MKAVHLRRGFTLTELLVVLAIIAVLTAIAVPVSLKIRGSAQRTACLSNLRQIGVAMESYLQDHGQTFPQWPAGRSSKNQPGPSMEADLAPYTGNPELFHCPADAHQFAHTGSSYIWNTTQNGRNRYSLAMFGNDGDAHRIPLISDKEGWHSGSPTVNFLYADMSASSKVQFGVNE